MENNTGYPHPPPEYTQNPPPQYTANPVPVLQPPVITQQPGNISSKKWTLCDGMCHGFSFIYIDSIYQCPLLFSISISSASRACPHATNCRSYADYGRLLELSSKCVDTIGIWGDHANTLDGVDLLHIWVNESMNVLVREELFTIKYLWIFFSLIPCAIMPYCMTSCQNGNHYCPNCGSFVGTYTQWTQRIE